MARYAAFLRAINLGRNRRVSSAELRSCFEQAGLEQVASFRTSGNVVFEAGRASRAQLTNRVEAALEQALGYEVPIFLRSAAEVEAIAAERPFSAKLVAASQGKLQVALLPSKPTASKGKAALALQTDDDRLALGARELYWLPSAGTMDSSLDRTLLDELVGPSTLRTKGTIEQLAAKLFAG